MAKKRKPQPSPLSDAEVEAAIAEARRHLLAQIAECKNQHLLALDIEAAVTQADLWDRMNRRQRQLAMRLVREIQGLDNASAPTT